MSQPKIKETAIFAIVLALVIVFSLNIGSKQDANVVDNKNQIEQVAQVQSIDSSSCVACHTSETVIAASTYGKDKAPAVNTGG